MVNDVISFLSRKPFSIIGHRGTKGLGSAYENTLKGIGYALNLGVDLVEVDVRLTKDKIPIIMHDENFSRVANVPLKPKEMDYEEIKAKIRIGGTEPVPSLSEIIDYVNGKCGLFIEIKEAEAVNPVLKVLEKHGYPTWAAIVSFHEEVLEKIAHIKPEIVTGLIYAKPPGKIVEAKRLKAKIVLPHFRLATAKAVAFAHKLKLKVVAWTVNKPEQIIKLAANKVDAIATDYPETALKTREKYKNKVKF
mgnify:CR=1 FL=1